MFSVVQQQLSDYIVALQDVLPYVTASLSSATYVDLAPNASKNINYLTCMKSILLSYKTNC